MFSWYNLLSVISASKKGMVTIFLVIRCEVRDSKSKIIAMRHREGSLYYLDHTNCTHQACVSSVITDLKKPCDIADLDIWKLKLAKSKMAKGLNFDCK